MEGLTRALRSFHERHERIKHKVHTVRLYFYHRAIHYHLPRIVLSSCSDLHILFANMSRYCRRGDIHFQDGDNLLWDASIFLFLL